MRMLSLLLLIPVVLFVASCEEETPDYSSDLVGQWRVIEVYSDGETYDLSNEPEEVYWIVEFSTEDMTLYENSETVCEDTYDYEIQILDGVTAASILFDDGSFVDYEWDGALLVISDDYDRLTLERFIGTFPPQAWTDDDLLYNDTYEPNNQSTVATAIAAGGTVQNHFMRACGDYDFFVFSAEEGKTYIMETMTGASSDLDLYLTLYSGAQVYIDDADDQSDFDLNPKLVWTCELSGDYYFVIESYYYEDFGSYAILVLEDPGAVSPAYESPIPKASKAGKKIRAVL